MKEQHHSHSIRDVARRLTQGIDVERTTSGLERLFLQLAYKTHPEPIPPEYVPHVFQVKTVASEALRNTNETEREWGDRYSLGHDIGRPVDHGPAHTLAGARILHDLNYWSSVTTYTLAHHRWGLGVPILTQDNFPRAVDEVLSNGNVHTMVDEIIAKRGLAALAVLLADNSKRPVASGSFETEISPFNFDHAQTLIEIQISRGRYQRGSREHAMDELGARFLSAMIPHLENRLGITYAPDGTGNDIISRSLGSWPREKESLLAKWQKIHYDEAHGHQNI